MGWRRNPWIKMLLAGLSLFLMTVTPLLAAGADLAQKPWIDRTTVNGMNIILQKTKSKVVDIVLLLKSGSGLDDPAKKGTALVMNNLVWLKLYYGDFRFGEVEVETYSDYTLVKLRTIPKNTKKALQEIKDLLSYPLYSYDIIADLKNLYQIDVMGMPPFAMAYYEFTKEFYGKDHPYNDWLDTDTIKAITGSDVYQWYRKTYQPGNALLSISGAIPQNINWLKSFFARMQTETVDRRLIISPITLNSTRRVEGEDQNGILASVCIGFAAPRIWDPEYAAYRIISFYLEEYMHYFEELRVKEGLFYAGFVFYNYLDKPKAPNIVFLSMVEPESIQRVEEKTLAVIAQIVNEGIPQEEINQIVAAIKTSGMARINEGWGLAVNNALSYYLQTEMAQDQNLYPYLEQVKTEDIRKVAAKYFQNYIRAVYKPKERADNF
ncbi:MAG: insulinase family protein [Firmicutes bacterium]|nr:insulinase family protein [Bacillota bacterium]